MNDDFQEDETRVLSALVRHTRTNPDLFSTGKGFLAEHFTRSEIRARRIRDLQDDLDGGPALLTEHVHKQLTDARGGEFNASDLPPVDLVRWVGSADTKVKGAHRGRTMHKGHAEAVILAAAFFWDRSSTPNPALPDFLNEIPWGTPEGTTGATFLTGRWLWISAADKRAFMAAVRYATNRFHTETGLDLRIAPIESGPLSDDRVPPSPSPEPPRSETAPAKRRRSREAIAQDRALLDAKAAVLLHRNPDWTLTQLARELGVTRSRLSDHRRPLTTLRGVQSQIAAEREGRAAELGGIERLDTLRGSDD